ncbi:hypothetical protein [Herbaspirillum sp. alder98]|uniref:hypothetical protein n=1 Tax=Herbaspirillum sp. alder98 TaxID=2913096 RepID=UPI001CD901CF|nr:hypothetical protein [Herbaspirillum sp. alder98]MCA1324568.1 hypothetical protein [Herbaspirillum sp. alder98]
MAVDLTTESNKTTAKTIAQQNSVNASAEEVDAFDVMFKMMKKGRDAGQQLV